MDYNPPKMWNGCKLGPIQSYLVTNLVRLLIKLSHVALHFRRQTYKVDVCNDDKQIM